MKAIALALVGTLAAACSPAPRSLPVETAASPSAPLARYRTFSFGLTEDPPLAYEASARSLEVEHRMRALVANALEQKGYVEDAAKPSFVVRFAAGTRRVERATFVEVDPERSTDDDALNLQEIKVDIYDAATKTQVWRGSVVSEVDLAKAIDGGLLLHDVRGVLASFPARSAGAGAPAADPLAETRSVPVDRN